ncbi:helix-turn-helix domain-containing protein [Spirillospora sp. NPDC048911]|uniref:helix-turn-helix domain-containing protein n=1 Tax=Spirillospora sp. NPDC048911 TaxID=3364527 RepID=UPI0037193BDD
MWRTVQEIHKCCGVSLLKAHRLARGWTARTTVQELERLCRNERLEASHVNTDMLNSWENGRSRPRPDSQDRLARLYRTNAVRLGLAADYADDELAASASAPRGEEWEAARRIIAEAEMLRKRMNRTLVAGTITHQQVDDLDETVLRYRDAYTTTPPLAMLSQLILDLGDVQALAADRQTATIQRRLSGVTATLAVLAADAFMKLGDTRQARAWYATARTAADDTGDRRLRALVRAQEAMLPFYYSDDLSQYGGDLSEVIRLAREAQSIGRGLACSPVALAAAAEARALARVGEPTEAERALGRARNTFARIEGVPGRAFDFSEQRLHLYISGTHAYLPDTSAALSVQTEAFEAQPASSATLDPRLIQLDQAISLARAGDAATACQIGQDAILVTPPAHRTHILFARAHEVLAALPAPRAAGVTSGFRELLQIEGQHRDHA